MPRESAETFEKRIDYMELGPKRSYPKLAEKRGVPRNADNFKRTVKSLTKLGERWDWNTICKLYDVEQLRKKVEEKASKFHQLEETELAMLEVLIKSLHNLIAEFVNNPNRADGDSYSLSTRVKLHHDILSAFEKADLLLRRLTGQPTDYTRTDMMNAIEVNATVLEEKSREQKDDEENRLVEQFISRKIKEAKSSVEENSVQ